MDPTRGDSRYNLNYSMSSIGLSLADQSDMYGNPTAVTALGGRPPSGSLLHMGGSSIGLSPRSGSLMPTTTQCQSLVNSNVNTVGLSGASAHQQQHRGIKRAGSDCYDDHNNRPTLSSQVIQGLDSCSSGGNGQHTSHSQSQPGGGVSDVVDDSYNSLQNKKSPPANGKKTKGRVKIKMEYIDNKLRRYTTFSKRKTGIMKKAYELSTLTGTQVMLLVASETGHVYTFATRKLQPMITSEAGKQLIQTCLNSPDPPSVGGGDQRMSATGFEETELSYNIVDEDSKEDRSSVSSGNESDESSDIDSPILTSTNTKSSAVDKLQVDKSIATGSSAVQTNINMAQRVQPKKSCCSMEVVNPQSDASLLYPTSALSSVPQDVLLQLIQCGHLQLHTEEDGSGHQYVAIPLTSSTANLLKSSQSTTTSTANTKDCLEARNKNEISSLKDKQEYQTSTTTSGLVIKQESV